MRTSTRQSSSRAQAAPPPALPEARAPLHGLKNGEAGQDQRSRSAHRRRLRHFFAPLGLLTLALIALTATPALAKTYTIAIDLDIPTVTTPHGKTLGYAPMETHVKVGDHVRFLNVDDEAHTATSPSILDFKPHGSRLSTPWSTGSLVQEQSSSLFLADKAGVYHYVCRYHLASKGQMAVIVVSP
jgi:plastocyanin